MASAQYPLTSHESFADWQRYVGTWVREATDNGATLLVFPEYGSLELVSTMSQDIQSNLKLQTQEMIKLHDAFIKTYQEYTKKYKCTILTPSLPARNEEGEVVNRAYLIGPSGGYAHQEKQHLSRFEVKYLDIAAGEEHLQVFETPFADIGVNICLDVEFPQAAHALAQNGVKLLLVPSCTDVLAGVNRVHIGARARALENQHYVVVSQTVGEALWFKSIPNHSGYAAVYGPPDVGFPDDGIVAQGELNQPGWLYADIDFSKVDHVREHGQALNFQQS